MARFVIVELRARLFDVFATVAVRKFLVSRDRLLVPGLRCRNFLRAIAALELRQFFLRALTLRRRHFPIGPRRIPLLSRDHFFLGEAVVAMEIRLAADFIRFGPVKFRPRRVNILLAISILLFFIVRLGLLRGRPRLGNLFRTVSPRHLLKIRARLLERGLQLLIVKRDEHLPRLDEITFAHAHLCDSPANFRSNTDVARFDGPRAFENGVALPPGSKIGGRIAEVRMREGDFVQPGQVLVTFDDQELKAALEQSRANFQKMTRGYRPEEIAEARAAAEQAKADYEEKKNGYRQEDIDAARAELDRAKADEVRSEADFHRYDSLAKKEMVSRQQRDTAGANWKMAAAQRQSAEKKLAELERGYRPEEIAAAEARYKQTVATYEKLAHGNRREDIEQARAQLDYDEARYREREVLAPSAATVEVLDVRPGDLIGPNTPIATLLERNQIYVRIYIPETEIGRVRLGQKGEVRVDSFPKTVFA